MGGRMNEFLKMDIFFMVTTVAVIVITILLMLLLIRVLRILKNIEDISLLVEEEGQHLREDIAQVRDSVKREGLNLMHVFDFLAGGKRKRTRSRQRSHTS